MNRARSLAVVLSLLAACSQRVETPEEVPASGHVLSFTADPSTLAAPGDVTLSWSTQDATAVELSQIGVGPLTIDPAAAAGTLTVKVERSSAFLLTARGPGGSESKPIGVSVGNTTGGLLFDAVPRQVEPGAPVTLSWYAPGASSISLKEAGVGAIDAQGQTVNGAVVVYPTRPTTYRIEVNGSRSATALVDVKPVIRDFSLEPSPVALKPGGQVTVRWETGAGQSLTLTRAGAAMPLATETDPAQVAKGAFTDTVPANALPNGVLTYALTVTQGTTTVEALLEVRLGGALDVTRFDVPRYAKAGADVTASWTTTAAARLELRQDGTPVYLAGTPAQVAAGSTQVRVPSAVDATSTVALVVRDAAGNVRAVERMVEAVGTPAFNLFTGNPLNVPAGGAPVTLSWSVTQARHVTITDKATGQVVVDRSGAVGMGSTQVFPNRASVTYVLTADNGAAEAIAPREVTVTVATPATLTYARRLPVGATVSVTGHTADAGLPVLGLPLLETNRAGEAFVDIQATGTALTSLSDTTPQVATVPAFGTVLWGRRVQVERVSVSPNGWVLLGGATASSPTSPGAPLGTSLDPLALAPWAADLYVGTASKVHWQEDQVAGVPRLVVQWTNMEEFLNSGTQLTFQVQVYGSGKVVFAYQRLDQVTAAPGIGVVNGSETDELGPTARPAAGDTLTFFDTAATLPFALKAEDARYVARLALGQGAALEVEGDPRSALSITEVNPRPLATVTAGEWVEVTNTGSAPEDLLDYVLDFGGTSTFTLPTLIVPAGGRVLLAQAADLGDGAAATAAVIYPGALAMADATGTLRLRYGTAVQSAVTWDSTQTATAGTSVVFDPRDSATVYASSLTQLGCASGATTTPYGNSGQLGTPGGPNPRCFPYALSALPTSGFQVLSDAGTQLVGATFADGGTVNDALLPLTLSTPVLLFGQSVSTLSVSTNGFVAVTAPASSLPTNRTLPATPATVAPFWDDLVVTPGAASGIYVLEKDPDATPGSGDEYAIISWEGLRPSATSGAAVNFQVKLFASGAVEFHYGQLTAPAGTVTANGSSATAWVEHPGGKAALSVSVNQPKLSSGASYRFSPAP